ncbi:hypothetical protein [Lacipirellula parvula]|nr:hypothetical protein [Lacipirellula parvula]
MNNMLACLRASRHERDLNRIIGGGKVGAARGVDLSTQLLTGEVFIVT